MRKSGHCGEMNHILETKKRKTNNLYVPKCLFHEWSIVSGQNVYYETDIGKKICMYCRNFCEYDEEKLIKKREKKVPACECESHYNIKDIFVNINKIASNYINFEFENLSLIHFMNLLFISKKSFENVYKPFETYVEKFRKEVMLDKFQFDPNMGFSVFSFANSNFSFLVFYIKNFYYFSESIKKYFTSDYIFRCLEVKSENNNVWVIKEAFFQTIALSAF